MATGEQAHNNPLAKQPQMECTIHCSDDEDKLVSLKSVDSWKTLLRAAQIRNHEPVLEQAEGIPEGSSNLLPQKPQKVLQYLHWEETP